MTKDRWLAERSADPWYRMAKNHGYPSRAAFKLIYVQRKYHLIRRGDVVVDLGSAPGGMCKVASMLTGKSGRVIAVDIRPLSFSAENVTFIRLDITSEDAIRVLTSELGDRLCDVLISDASPRLTGVREVDVLKQLDLTVKSLELADEIVKIGGNVLLKAFECEELRPLESALRRGFGFYKRIVTSPTLRKHSSEVYLLCMSKKLRNVSQMVEIW